MKLPQKLEPYQRSRHRAALHAWVVAATAVASIGMPALAAGWRSDAERPGLEQSDERADQAAQRTAKQWLDALRVGDRDAALSSMYLPRALQAEQDAADDLAALSDWLVQSGAEPEPVAHRRAGHWALSAWRLNAPGTTGAGAGPIEPVTLYNPAADELFGGGVPWQVVPIGYADDPALAPLYNADHDALLAWYKAIA